MQCSARPLDGGVLGRCWRRSHWPCAILEVTVLACGLSRASPIRGATAPNPGKRAGASEVDVKRAPDATAAAIEDVGVDHGGAHVVVAE
jgi:hypothetical protein